MITIGILGMTVEKLRTELTKLELSKVNNKAELHDRIMQHYELNCGDDLDHDEVSSATDRVVIEQGNIQESPKLNIGYRNLRTLLLLLVGMIFESMYTVNNCLREPSSLRREEFCH